MKQFSKLFLFIIIDVIFIILIIVMLKSKILPNQKKEAIATNNIISSYNGIFQISVPNNWKLIEQRGKLNPAADIELVDNENLYYCIFLMENKLDLNISYSEYKRLSFKLIEDTYNTKIDKTDTLNSNGYDINYTKLNTKLNDNDISMYAYILETKNYYGKCLIWSSLNNSTALDSITNDIIKGFKEI